MSRRSRLRASRVNLLSLVGINLKCYPSGEFRGLHQFFQARHGKVRRNGHARNTASVVVVNHFKCGMHLVTTGLRDGRLSDVFMRRGGHVWLDLTGPEWVIPSLEDRD